MIEEFNRLRQRPQTKRRGKDGHVYRIEELPQRRHRQRIVDVVVVVYLPERLGRVGRLRLHRWQLLTPT